MMTGGERDRYGRPRPSIVRVSAAFLELLLLQVGVATC